MTRRIPTLAIVCCLGGLAAGARGGPQKQSAPAPRPVNQTPTTEEVRALADRAINSQHQDDAAIEGYERFEHHIVRSSARDHVSEDKTYRVVPTGTGTLKLLLKDDGKPVSQDEYFRQLQAWAQILERIRNPNDPRVKADFEKTRKRQKDRADLVDAARHAFHATWLGHETLNGRSYAKLLLEPNPDFHPSSRTADILTHARATIWIDEASGQLARGDAEIIRDISFGGGILGKVYRGGRFQMEQSEISPGVWLPRRYQYDFMGRKFLFGFEVHEYTEISRYRRLGSPSEALSVARDEIQKKQGIPGDP